MMTRRSLTLSLLAGASSAASGAPPAINSCDLFPVRATARTAWLFVRLRAADGLEGWGEASDAFGFANTTKAQAQKMEAELRSFAGLANRSIDAYTKAARDIAAKGSLVTATAYSAVEQALWDLAAQRRRVPIHKLLARESGQAKKQRPIPERLRAYANINRATSPRNPEGFAASARRAVAAGFSALKLAPFDGFPPRSAPAAEITRAIDTGIESILAVRQAVGGGVDVLVDCHSFFTVPESIEVARRLEPASLGWYEEPVAPGRAAETLEIRRAIRQRMAGGETLFGVEGFEPLVREQAVHVIMPDVKHCGGLAELLRIARRAESRKVEVSPHNPSGPIATLHTLHAASTLPNARLIEHQFGEVDWRPAVIEPPEVIEQGFFPVPGRPGLGARLNEDLARRHAL